MILGSVATIGMVPILILITIAILITTIIIAINMFVVEGPVVSYDEERQQDGIC